MMVVLPIVVVTISTLFSITLVLVSCTSCKRIVRRKKQIGNKGIGENGEIVSTDNKKLENGLSNPAYATVLNDDEDGKTNPLDRTEADGTSSELNGIPPRDIKDTDSVQIENECSTKRTPKDISITEDEQRHDEEKTTATISPSPKDHKKIQNFNCNELGILDPAFKSSMFMKSTDDTNSSSSCDSEVKKAADERNDRDTVTYEKEEETDIPLEWSKFENVVLQGGWRKEVKLLDLLKMKLINEKTAEEVFELWKKPREEADEEPVHEALKPFLYGETPVAGILVSETGETKSIFRSAKDGILRRGTAISLLEAQAATGNIIDPVTGRKMSVSEGFQLGFLDKVYETVVSRAERAVSGYRSRVTDEVMSLGQAMERGLVIESHGTRLLEVQLATGGIIDHNANVKVPINTAIKRGLLNKTIAEKLSNVCKDISDDQKDENSKTFFDPNTEENVTYRELMRRSVVDDDTGMRLYPLEKITRRRFSYASYSGRSSLASSRATSRESIPAALANEK